MNLDTKIAQLHRGELPRHVAIIMDGNGRWSKASGWPRTLGHREGAKRADELIRFANQLGLEELTLYAFSEENWRRPGEEVSFLMRLLASYIRKLLRDAKKQNIRLKVIGRIEKLPDYVRSIVADAVHELSSCDGLTLTLALSYSGRDEIAEAASNMLRAVQSGNLMPEEVNETLFDSYMPSQFRNPPDLLIRTSGEKRVSNFLLWQIAYAELIFVDEMWPDFTREIFVRALLEYQKRERRFGGVETVRRGPALAQHSGSDALC